MARVRIGTIGWLFDSWNSSYFPEDIPQEWKLAFYANDFPAVVVPYSMWGEADLEQLEEMAEDLYEDFMLYFQIESRWPSAEKIREVETRFAANFQAFLVEQSHREVKADGYRKSFILPAADADGAWCTWSGLGSAGSSDCVIRLTQAMELRLLREQFEKLRTRLDFSRDLLVLVDWPEPDTGYIKQLSTLLELMMIA